MKRLAVVVSGGLLLLASAGCDAVDQVSQTADNVSSGAAVASVCVDALKIGALSLDKADPQASVDKAHSAAEELTGLAAKSTDASVDQALNDLAKTLRETTISDATNSTAAWVQRKADQVSALAKACTPS